MSSFPWHQIYSGWSEITAHGSEESDPKNGVVYKFYWMTQYIQSVYQGLLNLVIPCFLDWNMFLRNEWTNWKHGSLYFSNAMQDSCITRAVIMPILRWAAGGQTNQRQKPTSFDRLLIGRLVKIIILAGAFSILCWSCCCWQILDQSQFSLFVTNFKLVELFYPGQEYNFLWPETAPMTSWQHRMFISKGNFCSS